MALNQLTDLQPTNIKVTGIATFDQTVGIAGTLTYQDVTNVDAVGILTARSDINALGNIIGDNATNISGINSVTATTFYGNVTGNINNSTLLLQTGGTERLRISSSGKVNIGDNQTSQNILNIEDGTAASMEFASHGTGGDTAYIGVKKSSGGGLTFGISNRDIIFKTGASYSGGTAFDGGTEKLRIASNGDVTASHSGLAVNIFESTDNHSRFRIKSADASLAQLEFADQTDADAGEIRYDHANDKMTFHVGNNTERVGIDSSGNVTKPSNAIFHAFGAPSAISTNTDIVFGQERFDVGGGYNTSTGEYTAPATGYYHFYAQVYRQRTHDDSAWGFFVDTGSGYSQISEARMENDHGGDSGRGYATLQCSIYWYMTAGHKMKCRVTTPGDVHCNTAYSYFCGNLVG